MNKEVFRKIVKLAVGEVKKIKNDQVALEYIELYPDFKLSYGKTLTVGQYIQDEGKLFKVIQEHECGEHWKPEDSPTLFQAIEPEHEGTVEDPIPARLNMIYEEGLYYISKDIIYKCIRNSEIALQQLPEELVEVYFEVVEK